MAVVRDVYFSCTCVLMKLMTCISCLLSMAGLKSWSICTADIYLDNFGQDGVSCKYVVQCD